MGDNKGREMNNETEITSIITELENLLKELAMYHYLQRKRGKSEHLTPDELRLVTRLRSTLLRKSGEFKSVITDEDRKENMRTFWIDGKESLYDIWNTGLKFDFDWLASEALDYCKDATDVAIGKLGSDIKKGKRDKQGNLIKLEKTQSSSAKPPKAFISHGKASTALNKLKEFLETLGVEVLIVKKQPSLDKDLPDKVNLYLSQADFVIILATADDKVEDKLQPRQNVIHEIGLAQNTHSGKIIYLLEEGAEFPSNISPKVWERFKQRNMLNAFLCILRELRALGILLAVKPQEGASS